MGLDIDPEDTDIVEKIEAYILELGFPFDKIDDELWVIHDDIDYIDNIVVYHNPPVLTFRIKVMDAPPEELRPPLYRRLLQLNASSMVTGAFGLEDEDIVVIESLRSDTMSQNEFQNAFDSLTLEVREHFQDLKSIYRQSIDDENQQDETEPSEDQREKTVGAADSK